MEATIPSWGDLSTETGLWDPLSCESDTFFLQSGTPAPVFGHQSPRIQAPKNTYLSERYYDFSAKALKAPKNKKSIVDVFSFSFAAKPEADASDVSFAIPMSDGLRHTYKKHAHTGKTMARAAQTPPPPYFNINPEDAARKLSDPINTARFAKAASFAARGRDDLAKRGYAPDGRKRLRKFSTWEVCKYLIPVAPAHFRRVLKQNPALPQGEGESGSKWFTLADVLQLRDHFAAEGVSTREYRPWRPEGLDAKVLAVANFKGGVGKTSTAAHLAMSAALDGYKVLVVDLDSQGSMTSIMGGQVEDEWQTAFPLMAKHYAQFLEKENQVREAAGHGPLPLDETLKEALNFDAKRVIQATHWPNIDLIGAQLNLYWAEFQVPVWRMQLRSWPLWDALTGFLEGEDLLSEYDLIILDTPPALGYLTINALAAADILLIPLGASFLEFDSTGRFFDMLYSTFASIEDGENALRRQHGLEEIRFEWDAVRALITRFDAAQQTDLANVIQAYFGDFMTTYRQDVTAMVGQAGEQVNGIYEADYREFNRDTYVRGRETFDRTWAEVKELILGCWWRDLQMANAQEEA